MSSARRGRFGTIGAVGASTLVFIGVVAAMAPWLAPFDPVARVGRPFEPPGARHLLGTDDVGRDLFSQLLHGARSSLVIGVSAALFAVTVGFAVALIAGYSGGSIESVLMRIVDLMIAFPFFVLVVVLSAFFGQGLLTTIVVIGAVIWARPARVLRSQVIRIRELEHVAVATAMGATPWRIITRHLLPRVAPLAAAQFVRAANVAVLVEASLSFLGLGDPDRVSWGTTLFFAQVRNAFLTDAWLWWVVPPGLALTAVIVGFAYLGHAVEEWADPRIRRRRRLPARVRTAVALDPPDLDGEDPVLEIERLCAEYRGDQRAVRAVHDVSLRVHRGEIVGLVGESGSGKSTLVMATLGLLRPPGRVTSGSVRVNGRDVGLPKRSGIASLRGREISLIPQNAMNALNPSYTVVDQVAEAAALRDGASEPATRAREVLDLVGIPAVRHEAFPHELSGGMRQRVLIAMALVNEPTVLVADEPLSGLDVVTQAEVIDLLLGLRARLGVGVLLVSHDLPLVGRVADRIVVMYAGTVVEAGPARAVTGIPDHPYSRLLVGAYPPLRGPHRQLLTIPGDPPDLSRLPPGCPFHPRCPDATETCREHVPELISLDGRATACPVVGRR